MEFQIRHGDRRSFLCYAHHILIVIQWRVAGNINDFDVGANGQRSARKRLIDALIGLGDAFKAGTAHIAFQTDGFGNGIHHIAAVGDDGMHADDIRLTEGFADGIDRIQAAVSSIQRVAPIPRRSARMCGNALVNDALGYTAHRTLLHGRYFDRGMHHKGQINAVKQTAGQEFRLAAKIPDLAFRAKLTAVLDFQQFLRRNSTQADSAAQAIQRAGFFQGSRYADQRGALRIVAAGVNRARYRVRLGMVGADDGVQFAQNQQFGARTAGINAGDKTGQIFRTFQFIAQSGEDVLHVLRGFFLTITGFGMLPDIAFRFQDQIAVLVHRIHQVLHFRFSFHYARVIKCPGFNSMICSFKNSG